MKSPQRILVVLLLPIGDTLFATPALRAVRMRYPEAHITGLVYKTNGGILAGNPDLDELVTYPTRAEWAGILGFFRFLATLRRRRFNLVIEFSNFLLWFSVAIGVWRRVRFAPPWFWWAVPRHDAWKTTHAARHYADVLRPLGIEVPDLRPRLFVSPEEDAAARAFLASRGAREGDMLIGMHPGGEGFRGMKQWNRGGFVAVASLLARRYGARIVLLGGPADMEAADEIASTTSAETVIAAGHVSLKETAAIARRCALFIGNDSSPLHIAVAVGTPAVGIYGPTNQANFHPLGDHHGAVAAPEPLPCQPCFHFVGAHPVWQNSMFCRRPVCLERVSALRVLDAAERLLGPPVRPDGDGGADGSLRLIEVRPLPQDWPVPTQR